jgi:aminopeptidase N
VLPAPTQADQPRTFTFQYSGKRVVQQVGPGNYFAESFGWYPTHILNERTAGNEFADRYDFHLHFRCPKQYELVATGDKVSDTIDGKDRITEWKSDIPLAVAGLAYGDYKIVTQKVGDVEVEVFANKEPDNYIAQLQGRAAMGIPSAIALAPTIATEMGNALRTFEKYYGPYPYKQLAVTNIPYSFGQGWPGLIYLSILTFLDETQRHQIGLPPDPRITEFFRAHETSHQWWGHRVGWKSYHDQWLSEGFAEFSGNLYTQLRDDQKKYIQRLKDDRQQLEAKDEHSRVVDSVGPVWMGYRTSSSLDPRDPQYIIYSKGGYALTMLRMMLEDPTKPDPDARFEEMMHDFCSAFDNKAASTEDFKAIAEKHMTPGMDLDRNHKLDWFFNQYVYGTGIPHYEFHADVGDAGNGKWKLTGTLKRTGVPDSWMDLVPLFVQHNGQSIQLGFITAAKPEMQFTTTLSFNPGKVQININEELLAEVKQ